MTVVVVAIIVINNNVDEIGMIKGVDGEELNEALELSRKGGAMWFEEGVVHDEEEAKLIDELLFVPSQFLLCLFCGFGAEKWNLLL